MPRDVRDVHKTVFIRDGDLRSGRAKFARNRTLFWLRAVLATTPDGVSDCKI